MSNQDQTDPRPAAVAFATSELFALQSGRASTIAESVGRAGMFLSAVSGGLVAWGWSPARPASTPRSTPSRSCSCRR